jgi:hypothetical protein
LELSVGKNECLLSVLVALKILGTRMHSIHAVSGIMAFPLFHSPSSERAVRSETHAATRDGNGRLAVQLMSDGKRQSGVEERPGLSSASEDAQANGATDQVRTANTADSNAHGNRVVHSAGHPHVRHQGRRRRSHHGHDKKHQHSTRTASAHARSVDSKPPVTAGTHEINGISYTLPDLMSAVCHCLLS